MDIPECFVSKCIKCEYKNFCKAVLTPGPGGGSEKPPTEKKFPYWPAMKKTVKRKLRAGKKIKDMNKDELHEYWREQAAKKRKRLLDEKQNLTPTGKKVMAGLQKNADVLKKIKEENHNAVPERP